MQTGSNTRDSFVDAVKGIGIFSIVIGHASWDITVAGFTVHAGPFVYLYHLAVFFFCSGYLFRDTVEDFWGYAAKKLKGLYRPFVGYSLLYFVFRSGFIYMGILDAKPHSPGELVIAVTNAISFQSIGEFLAAFWFLPVLFFGLCIYTAVMCLTRRVCRPLWREAVRAVFFAAAGAVGIYAMERGYGLLFNLQVAYLMIPVLALGHYCAIYKETLARFRNPVCLAISFFLLVWVVESGIGQIELSRFQIINRYAFYPVTVCGIWFCLCLAELIGRSGRLGGLFALFGRMSFDIMALHFLALKLLDWIVCHITGELEIMNAFPHSYTGLWPLYYTAGMAVPVFMKKAWLAATGRLRAKEEG